MIPQAETPILRESYTFTCSLSQVAAGDVCCFQRLSISVKEFSVDWIALRLDMTFLWYLELFFLGDRMIYGIRKNLILRVVFH